MTYFILQNGEQRGPYHESRVRQLLAEGRIKDDDLAWREGLAEWAPLSSLIFVARAGEPPPTPAVYGAGAVRSYSAPMGMGTKLLLALGALGVILVAAAVGFGLTHILKVSRSAQDYVDAYVAHIAPAWSADGLLKRVTPKYSDKFDPKVIQAMFKKLSGLGNLKHAEPSTASANINASTTGDNIVANVEAHATFDNGDATFSIYLVQVDGQWTIAGFHVESPIFFK